MTVGGEQGLSTTEGLEGGWQQPGGSKYQGITCGGGGRAHGRQIEIL